MQEKKMSLDDAMLVWWFVTWRTILTVIGVYIVLGLIIRFTPLKGIVPYLPTTIPLIISIFIQVLYFKLAINRNYKNFRLSALINNEQQYEQQSNQQ